MSASLLNRAAVKRFALDAAVRIKPFHKFSRVGASFIDGAQGGRGRSPKAPLDGEDPALGEPNSGLGGGQFFNTHEPNRDP